MGHDETLRFNAQFVAEGLFVLPDAIGLIAAIGVDVERSVIVAAHTSLPGGTESPERRAQGIFQELWFETITHCLPKIQCHILPARRHRLPPTSRLANRQSRWPTPQPRGRGAPYFLPR